MKNKIVRIIIAGGRDFTDYNLLKEKVDYYLQNAINNNYKIIIVSGTAKGADRLGEKYAKEKGSQITGPEDINIERLNVLEGRDKDGFMVF